MLPILAIEPDASGQHAFIEDILKAEGLFFFERKAVGEVDADRLAQASMIVALQGAYTHEVADRLRRFVENGGTLVTFAQCPTLLEPFDIAVGAVVEHAWVVTTPTAGLGIPCEEDLLCPGFVSSGLRGPGRELLKLRSRLNEHIGPAILSREAGAGRLVAFAYDPVATVINLRHGLDDFDPKPDTRDLQGPRHIHAIIGIADLYSQRVPIADVHMDLVREILLQPFSEVPVPRVWHFPEAASSMYFLKSDGCGEEGIEEEIALAESFDTPVTFYRNLPSTCSRAQLRQWHDRGHGIGIELNLNSITYGKTMAELIDADDTIRARIAEFVEDFGRNFGLPAASVCIHSCQWTGARMVRLLQEHGWQLADHFCGHDPRRNRRNYGVYCISSTLPMRYYDPEAGVMPFYLQPSQGDESQSVGWVTTAAREQRPQTLRIGFTVDEYAALIKRALADNDRLYHGVFIGNWHPIYLQERLRETEMAGFYNREAFLDVLAYMQEVGIGRGQLEAWTRFVDARNAIRIERMTCQPGHTELELHAPAAVAGLTVLAENVSPTGEARLDGRALPLQRCRLEGREQFYVRLDLAAGQRAVLSLRQT